MLNRIRRLNISLAAKCQLLFGSSVVLIIAAALFVPWQRMDQLTEQMNSVAGSANAPRASSASTWPPSCCPRPRRQGPRPRSDRFESTGANRRRLD